MANQFVKFLEKIEVELGWILGVSDLNLETYYTGGPDQTWVHPLQDGGAGFKHFLKHCANNGAILSPVIIIQALLYFLKAGLRLARMVAQGKVTSKRDLLKIAGNIIAGIVNLTLAITLLIGYMKIATVMYVAQEAIGWVKSGTQLVKAGFNWFMKKREYVEVSKGKSLSANEQTQKLQCLELDIQKQKGLAKNAAKKFTRANLLVGLTILSLLPIPIVRDIAQIILLGLVIITTVQICKERYEKYKEAKKAKQAQEPTVEPVSEPPGKANKKQAQIAQSCENSVNNLPVVATEQKQDDAQPKIPSLPTDTWLLTKKVNKQSYGYGSKEEALKAYLKFGLIKPETKINFSISEQSLTSQEKQAPGLPGYSLGN